MGQKVHPIGFRVGISRGWDSVWFAEKKDYTRFLHEDLEIRNFLKKKLKEQMLEFEEERRAMTAKYEAAMAKAEQAAENQARSTKELRESKIARDEMVSLATAQATDAAKAQK